MSDIIISSNMFERFYNKIMTVDDVKYLIKIINEDDVNYIHFLEFMQKIVHTYNAIVSLPSWYVKLTKKCTMCNDQVTIKDYDVFNMHYYCTNCKILNIFTKKCIIDNTVIDDFNNFIKKN